MTRDDFAVSDKVM